MLLEDVLEGRAALSTIDLIEKTAQNISWSADCAIGQEAADMVLKGVQGFRDDYEEHILHGRCTASLNQPVPCVSMCPAGVDIPGYIALVKEGRNADAVRLIRKDNPFPAVCAYICERSCRLCAARALCKIYRKADCHCRRRTRWFERCILSAANGSSDSSL